MYLELNNYFCIDVGFKGKKDADHIIQVVHSSGQIPVRSM